MSESYTKLFSSIIHSTVWTEPLSTRVVWVTMLALCDQYGVVHASVPGLCKAAGVERHDVEKALQSFLSPDKDSRTKDHEGRRIEVVDGGWRLLNHGKYRDKLSPDDRRVRDAERQKRWRERHRASKVDAVTPSHARNVTSQEITPVTTSDTDKYAERMLPVATFEAPTNMSGEKLGGERSDREARDTRWYDVVTGKDVLP
jgi:hypothetical protein